jgi:hypothetical protein
MTDLSGYAKNLALPAGRDTLRLLRYDDVTTHAIIRVDVVVDVRGINASLDLVWRECEVRDGLSFTFRVEAEGRASIVGAEYGTVQPGGNNVAGLLVRRLSARVGNGHPPGGCAAGRGTHRRSNARPRRRCRLASHARGRWTRRAPGSRQVHVLLPPATCPEPCSGQRSSRHTQPQASSLRSRLGARLRLLREPSMVKIVLSGTSLVSVHSGVGVLTVLHLHETTSAAAGVVGRIGPGGLERSRPVQVLRVRHGLSDGGDRGMTVTQIAIVAAPPILGPLKDLFDSFVPAWGLLSAMTDLGLAVTAHGGRQPARHRPAGDLPTEGLAR